MTKMRTMTHNSRTNAKGRVHGTKHNDRNFKTNAENIEKERTKDNICTNCYGDENLTFEQAEIKFYKENFKKQLEETNEKYIKNRHPERVKTMEEWKKIRQNAPEETVLQIGKMEGHATRQQLVDVYNDYNKWLQEWNNQHGNPFTVLNTALHCDEAVEHIQSRRVWHYRDENNELRIGQEKALKAAGVQLPDPTKQEGRRNNRKMTFDKMCRERWLDICHEHGIEVEREPVPNGRHNMDKEDMIRHKYETMLQEASKAEIRRDNAMEDAKVAQDAKTSAEADLNVLKADILAEGEVLNNLVTEHNEKVAVFNKLLDDTKALEKEKRELMEIPGRVAFVDEIAIERPRFKKGKVLMDEKDVETLKNAAKRDSALQHESERQAKQIRSMQAELDRREKRMDVLINEKYEAEREVKILQKALKPLREFLKFTKLEAQYEEWLQKHHEKQQRKSPERIR